MQGRQTVFKRLDASTSFHRDSRLGRIFHPGTDSYREISATESLHLAITPENHVSVHVDRVSPLTVGADSRCRYSLPRVVRHNVTHGAECLARLWGRHRGDHLDDHRCELDCQVVAVPGSRDGGAEAVDWYEFSCKAAGAVGCRWKTRAASEEDLLARVMEHARTVHGVSAASDTLTNYARRVALRA